MAVAFGGAALPALGYKNYAHLVFSSGPLSSSGSRVYPLGGERAMPLYAIRPERGGSATALTRHSFALLGYAGAKAVHVGTVHWAKGEGERRAWMERGVAREVVSVGEWMLGVPERQGGKRSRIILEEAEYEWAVDEKGTFVLWRCDFGRPTHKAAVYTPASPSKLFSRGQPATLMLNLESLDNISMVDHLSTLDSIILSLIIFARTTTDDGSGSGSSSD